MGEYQKMQNTNNEPLILEPEDWSKEEYEILRKLFDCPVGTTRIKVTFSCVEYFKEELDNKEISSCITDENEVLETEKIYAVVVREILQRTILTTAHSLEEAIGRVEESYYEEGKINLDFDDYTDTEIEASPCWEGGIFTGDEKLRKCFTELL